ncbi:MULTISPECIES: membrane protein insertion efficiency factor YidD [unclassified Oleiphilus]|nr:MULTISPECIES: membrane protein insertion efficiency factor YidD [unclassified Oleiphilus]
MRKVIIGLIRAYQLCISPILGPSCRYYPTCSEYALEAVKIHGIFKGSFLAVHRVLRCHPGCEGGHDPVPEKKTKSSSDKQSKPL